MTTPYCVPIRNSAEVEAFEAEPLANQGLPPSTYDALSISAKSRPDAKALSFFLAADTYDRAFSWTYAELLEEVTRAANLFHKLGVDAEHPVALVLPNLPETHFAIWGGEAAGVVLVINPLFEPGQIRDLLRVARARVLVTLAPSPGVDLWARLAPQLCGLQDLRSVARLDLSAYLPEGVAAPSPHAPHASVPGIDVMDFRAAMRAQAGDRLIALRTITAETKSSYLCTGGTTGEPKIAIRTHGNEVFDAWAAARFFRTGEAQRTVFCGLPLFHANAQLVTGLLPWMQGDHVVLGTPEGYRGRGVIARFWEIVAHYRVSRLSGVPTVYSALLDVPVGKNDISSLESALCGAAPMPAKLIDLFEAKTGVKIAEGYGLTEAACVSSVNPPFGEKRPGSIGVRLPYQRMRAVILDEAGRFQRAAETGEIGTLVIKGPNVFVGYLDPRHNKDLWIEIDGEKWLNTGDLGRRDADGYFWLTGRRKELIIRGGHNIDPKLIEDALHKHPAVAAAAAVGSPDAYAGEVPVAYVQTKPGAPVTEAELLDFATARIPERAAVPKRVRIAPQLPLTAVGKVFKPALQQREIEHAIRSEAQVTGVTILDIVLDRDPQLGLVARIRTDGGANLLQVALDRYAFQSDVREEHLANDS
jgi:fatty-acyl-CoA synthase